MGVDKCWVRRASSLAFVLAMSLWLAPSALATPMDIHSSGPLSDIWIGDNLACQVVHSGESVGDFFGGQTSGPASCGTTLSLNGSGAGAGVYGFAGMGYSSVSAPTLTGSGTQADPYVMTTSVTAGSTGVNVSETDTYVVGNEFYDTKITVTNGSNSAWSGAVYHSGDCLLNGSDYSFGAVDATNHTITCAQNPNNTPAGAVMQFADLTGGSHYFEGFYGAADSTYPSSQQDYPDTCDCKTHEDTGMGINWDFTLPSGQAATFTMRSTYTVPSSTITPSADNSLSGTAGTALSNVQLATFTDSNTDNTVSSYTATVDWGDDHSSPATVSGSNGSYTVTGSHTYASPGKYTITITITPTSGSGVAATDTATIGTIAATGGHSFSGSVPLSLNNADVARFTDTNSGTAPTDYTASIDWGDGGASTGTISGGNGTFSVTGSHTYSSPGPYTISVTITDNKNSSNTAGATDQVTVNSIAATGGHSFSGAAPLRLSNATLAGFTDTNTSTTPADYTASIDWGDGSSADAGTVSGSNGSFTVTGSHTYSSPGSWTIQVTITAINNSANTATASDTATATSPSPPPQHAAPTPVVTGTPSVTSSSTAVLTGSANPNNLPTTGHWIFGVDASERGPGFNGNVYDQSTPDQTVGSDSTSHTISLPVAGLLPNTLYRVRFVATNSAGQTVGPDQTFTTPSAPVQPVPPLGTENFTPSGKVFVLIDGKFVKLTQTLQLPSGTVVDTRQGSLTLVSSSAGGGQATDAKAKKSKKKIKTFTGTFGGAVFQVNQTTSGPNRGLTTLSLVEGITGAPSYASCKAKGAADASAALSGRILQTLRSRASGRYRTRGRYAAGTVRGTAWATTDRCDGTLIAVQQHSVLVTDLVKHKTILVRAGHSYLAQAPKGRKH